MWYGTMLLAATLHLGQAATPLDSIDVHARLGSAGVTADVAHIAPAHAVASWSSGFTYASDGIFVRVALDGHDVGWFLMDTGSNASVVDVRLVQERHLVSAGSASAEGATGTVLAPLYQLGTVSVSGAIALGITGSAQDLSSFPAPNGEHLAGILGSDFLGGFAVRVDYATRHLTFSASVSDSSAQGRTAVHFDVVHGAPRIPVTLDERVVTDFCIDTGLQGTYGNAPYVIVSDRVWRGLARAYRHAGVEAHVTAHGLGADDVTLPVVQIGSLAIADASVASLWVVPQTRRRSSPRGDAAGLLGNGVLERFSPITIDYLTGTLYLTVER